MRVPARHFAPRVTVIAVFSCPKRGKASLDHGKCVTHRLRGHRFPAFPASSAPAAPAGHEKRRHPPGTVFFVSVLCVQTNSLLIEMRITHRKNLLYVASILTPNYNMLISFQKPVVTVCKTLKLDKSEFVLLTLISLILRPKHQMFREIEYFRFYKDRIKVFLLQTLKLQPFKVMRMLTLLKCESFIFLQQSRF